MLQDINVRARQLQDQDQDSDQKGRFAAGTYILPTFPEDKEG